MHTRRSVYAVVLSVLLFLHPPLLSAQEAGQFGEVLEVRVTSVDVVVTDKDVTDFFNANRAQFNLPEDAYHLAQIIVTPVRDPQLVNRTGDDATTPQAAIPTAMQPMVAADAQPQALPLLRARMTGARVSAMRPEPA